ncbi:hypothetical protein ACKWRH_06500 [Bradyrhizobium sp. Pa8]|uniref:hypothetical protein n=1 Tax=Bradyrhizobium sp. Pa8 TaxID=3386552 RepID=UPI00403FB08F
MKNAFALGAAVLLAAASAVVSANAGTESSAPLKFAGVYAALTAGYDFSNGQTQYADPPPYAPWYPSKTPFTAPDAIRGGKAGGVVGYNAVANGILFGVEARGQYNFGDDKGGYTSVYSSALPRWIGSCWGCTSGYSIVGDTLLSQETKYTERVARPFSADLSFRGGLTFDDWLVYGRVGAGVEYSKRTTVYDKNSTCVNPVVTSVPNGGGLDSYLTSCGSIQNKGAITTTVIGGFNPIATVATGVERNFGAVFLRAEVELVVHIPNASVPFGQIYYNPAANLAVGYRF